MCNTNTYYNNEIKCEYLNTLEGKSLETLTAETVAYVKKIAEGQRTFGEKAHHSQVNS